MNKPDTKFIVVKNSKIHGTGVFARKDIKKGTRVIEYVGDKLTQAQSDKRADTQIEKHKKNRKANGAVYIFELNKRYDIDGNVSWNPARYINHSCNPNCETDIIRGHIWIIATQDIRKGEEISYNYGYDLEDYKDHPCHCKSKNCIGYIANDEYWSKLRKLLRKK